MKHILKKLNDLRKTEEKWALKARREKYQATL